MIPLLLAQELEQKFELFLSDLPATFDRIQQLHLLSEEVKLTSSSDRKKIVESKMADVLRRWQEVCFLYIFSLYDLMVMFSFIYFPNCISTLSYAPSTPLQTAIYHHPFPIHQTSPLSSLFLSHFTPLLPPSLPPSID